MVGIDAERVPEWIAANVAGVAPPYEFRLIAGGRSNLTLEVTAADGRRLILRRPPLGNVLPSAHDMRREFRILSALGPTGVPVPKVLAECADPAVNGAPFYLMEFAEGAILRDQAAVEASFPAPRARRSVADAFVDALGELHRVDVDAVGLGGLAKRGEYVERQLRRWQRQWEASRSREIPEVDETHRLLRSRVPAQQRLALVHGDYRLDNAVFAADASVAAILDWELCTLGDPLADLGLLLVYWKLQGEDASFMLTETPTLAPGFPSRQHLVERYAASSDLDLAELDYYVAFGLWKLACIAEGILVRYREGAMGEDPGSLARFEAHTPALARAALAAASRL